MIAHGAAAAAAVVVDFAHVLVDDAGVEKSCDEIGVAVGAVVGVGVVVADVADVADDVAAGVDAVVAVVALLLVHTDNSWS